MRAEALPTMKTPTLSSEVRLAASIDQVFSFFADAYNLEILTPPWLSFQVLTPGPITMQVGMRIDYRLRVHGLPVRWQSEITAWQPPHRFVDEQRRGPYRLWVHEHRFQEVGNGTLTLDEVLYAVPGGSVVNQVLVEPNLRKIFRHRQHQLQRIFGAAAESR